MNAAIGDIDTGAKICSNVIVDRVIPTEHLDDSPGSGSRRQRDLMIGCIQHQSSFDNSPKRGKGIPHCTL